MKNKGQVTIFIIIGILIIALVALFFVFKNNSQKENIPQNFQPVYKDFLSCLEEQTLVGINVLESQAGYIYLPEFEKGSDYMPFSSQLDFVGTKIPYWYYVSGNNIQKTQMPSKQDMEKELKKFIESKVNKCVADELYSGQDFEIDFGEPIAEILIEDNKVELDLKMNLVISKEDETTLIKSHKVSTKTNLGNLYDSAKKIYDYEQEKLFLEEYAIDTLRLYAPVDGVELSCSPKIWNADNIFDNLEKAIEDNTLSLKTKAGDYSLTKKENKYFVVDVSVDSNVNFINSKNWPSSFEVLPTEENILIANPVGNQPGLGALGFCYVPYHFVYNINYPVLIQVSKNEEIFQFPVAVVIKGNMPRESLEGSSNFIESLELCKDKNTLTKVNVYDTKMNSVDADIFYECFGEKCNIGETSTGFLEKEFPQCVNGFILAKADGFNYAKQIYSVVENGSVDIFLDKFYNLKVDLKLDNLDFKDKAIVSFVSDDLSKTIIYPEQKSVDLIEGQYEIQVHTYKNSNLSFEAGVKEQCIDIPSSGIGIFFGTTKKKCFDIEIPEQIISDVLSGGGTQNYYVLESELENLNVRE
jgi:hypothetical protein